MTLPELSAKLETACWSEVADHEGQRWQVLRVKDRPVARCTVIRNLWRKPVRPWRIERWSAEIHQWRPLRSRFESLTSAKEYAEGLT